MNVALIHDSFVEFGGAERVMQVLVDMYPDADIYTAFADTSFRQKFFPSIPRKQFHTSFLQSLPVRNHTSFVQAISPLLWQSFNLNSYDLVISHSGHLMSSFVRVTKGIHISLVQAPPKNIFGIDPPTPLQQTIHYERYIRPLYRKALTACHRIVANSKQTQTSLQTCIGAHSDVIYPPVSVPSLPPKKPNGKFFLCVSRIVPYKHLELAILAANILHVPLKIIGVSNTPPYERYLRHLAGPTVEFLGFRTKFDNYFAQSIAFIFTSYNEDFGIAPLEATAHGVPVIAYHGGGAKETVVEGVTGTFFTTLTTDAVVDAMKRIQTMPLDPRAMYRHAKRFSTDRFTREFSAYVNRVIQS